MAKTLAIIGTIAGVIATGGALAGLAGFALAGTAFLGMSGLGLVVAGSTIIATVAGTVAGAIAKSPEIEAGGISPTYSFGPLQTQASNQLCRQIIYGKVKCAGNIIWQDVSDSSTIKRVVCFADGPINSFSNVKFNDIAVSDLSGCSYTAYLGNGTQAIDSRIPGTTQTDKARVVGGLKYDAYLAITAKASEKINGGFNVTAEVEGSKVRVYTTTSTYTTIYSNNPAWCILDFLTSYNGCGISFDEIDIQSFLDAATYCNQTVDGQSRFTLNLILDVKKSRLDWLGDMLVCCRGYLTYQDGKVALKIEQVENTMQVFTPDNIITNSEKFWTTSREERYDIVKILYVDPNSEYIRVYAQAEAPVFQNEQPIVQEVAAYGVTNFKQASRLAWFYLNQAITCNKYISFQTTKEGLDRTVGDVIEITSTFLGYTNKKMRIIHMAEAQEGQIEVTCKEYNADLYSDILGSADPVYDVITLNPYGVPGDVQYFQASQSLNLVQFNWQEVYGSPKTYEIREGTSWDYNSTVIATNLSGTSYTIPAITGVHKYWIKAKSNEGVYSSNAVPTTLIITEIQSLNVIVQEDILAGSSGTFTNIHKNSQNWFILNSNQNWSNTGTWDGSGEYYNYYGNWGETDQSGGSYESQIYDIGGILFSSVNSVLNFYQADPSVTLKVEWKYSEDNVVWTNYTTFVPGNYQLRYYRFKLSIDSPQYRLGIIKEFKVSIDVPDRREDYRDLQITDANAGYTITFASHIQSKVKQSFNNTPSITANISNNINGYTVITSKSSIAATIKAYDNSGTAITANIDVHCLGY